LLGREIKEDEDFLYLPDKNLLRATRSCFKMAGAGDDDIDWVKRFGNYLNHIVTDVR